MGFLISIDNGGTLTDVCATDGSTIVHTKTITTPHDLTECFTKGLEALSEKILGRNDIAELLASVDHIRYSTTQRRKLSRPERLRVTFALRILRR